jgi:peptidoglycan hydrolase CwlO-like protein
MNKQTNSDIQYIQDTLKEIDHLASTQQDLKTSLMNLRTKVEAIQSKHKNSLASQELLYDNYQFVLKQLDKLQESRDGWKATCLLQTLFAVGVIILYLV